MQERFTDRMQPVAEREAYARGNSDRPWHGRAQPAIFRTDRGSAGRRWRASSNFRWAPRCDSFEYRSAFLRDAE